MTRPLHNARRLSRFALMLTTAVALSGCIFGDDSADVAVRSPTVFVEHDAERFVPDMIAEFDWLEANDPGAALRAKKAIIQIVGIEKLSVDMESFYGEGPAMPDFASIDPSSVEALSILQRALGDRLKRGVVLDDLPSIANDYLQVGIQKYQEAADAALKVLEKRRGELRDRQEQVRSIAGQMAFVKPVIDTISASGGTLTGQVVNLGPLPLVEMGFRASMARSDYPSAEDGSEQAVMADLLITFEPPLRSKETRALRGQALSFEGQVPEGVEALTGPVVIATRHVTPQDGGRLTGDEYAPALDYLTDLQQQIDRFGAEVSQRLRTETIGIIP